MREIDNYFIQKEEPVKSCLAALRHLILRHDPRVTEVWRYGMPFYCYTISADTVKRFCYLWIDKKLNKPYLGIVDGNQLENPDLISEKRTRMKIMLFDPVEDIPFGKLNRVLDQAIEVCRK